MKILFDHQAFTMQKYGGVSRCFAELYKQLSKENDVHISVRETDNVYLREIGYGQPVGFDYSHFLTRRHFSGKARLFAIKNRIKYKLPYSACFFRYSDAGRYGKLESIKALKEGNYDIFHPTFFDDYFLPYLDGKPFVLTIHDMIPELYPQYFDAENYDQVLLKRKLVPLASAIITVSENTKKDIIRILGVKAEKVHVVYHGSEHIQTFYDEPHSYTPYLLYVGKRNIYKNFDKFVEKVSPVLKNHPKLRVICAGTSFSQDEKKQMSKFDVNDKFIHREVANDEEMSSLYHNAKAFIYPSDYEGFGIPILEAYAAGCPVMLNNASCFPEIAGDAAVYFTLDNLTRQIEEVLQFTQQERDDLIFRQRLRLELYSWNNSARQVKSIYQSVLGKQL